MNLGVSLFQYNTSVFFRQTNIPTQICSQLTLLTFEVGRFLRQRLKPCPKRKGFKGKETAGFGLRAGSFPLVM